MSSSAKVKYHVSFENATSHQVTVQIEIPSKLLKGDTLRFKVPVWTPGSYKVREFARNITTIEAGSKGQDLQVRVEDKNSWLVTGTENTDVTIFDFDIKICSISCCPIGI